MLHPVSIVTIRKVLTCVGSPTFGACDCRVDKGSSLEEKIFELEGFDQVGIPDHRSIRHGEVGDAVPDRPQSVFALLQNISRPEYRCIGLHRALHLQSQYRGWRSAFGTAQPIEPGRSVVSSIPRQFRLIRVCSQFFGTAQSGRAPEHDNVSRELQPSRLAPCTETQAASPAAIKPMTVASGFPFTGFNASP